MACDRQTDRQTNITKRRVFAGKCSFWSWIGET